MSDPRRLPSQPGPAPDPDLLADYLAGELPARESARIARLVRDDAAWAEAYTALVAADAAVRSDLTAAGSVALTMPVEVAARLEAALAVEESGRRARSRSKARSLARDRIARTDRRWHRLSRRFATAIAVATASVVAVAGGVTAYQFTESGSASRVAADEADAPGDPGAAAPPELTTAPAKPSPLDRIGGIRVFASGWDYSPDTASKLAPERALASAASPGVNDAETTERFTTAVAEIDARLVRLAAPAALNACRAAVAELFPGEVEVIDYARYLGQPSLIMRIRAGTATVVVAVGPSCGLGTADVLDSVPA